MSTARANASVSPFTSRIIENPQSHIKVEHSLPASPISCPRNGTDRIIRHVRQESLAQQTNHLKLLSELTETDMDTISHLNMIIKHFPDGILMINSKGDLIGYNPAVTQIFIFDPLHTHITSLIPLSVHQFNAIRVGQSIDTMKVENYTETFEYKYKDLYLEVSYGRIKVNRKHKCYGFLIILKDVTKKHLYDEMLANLLPPQIMTKIRLGEKIKDTYHESVTIGFCDIVKFTQLTVENPQTISQIITELFDKFDEYTRLFNVTKIQRIGDSYMVACGLFGEDDHVTKVIQLMQHGIKYANDKMNLKLRVGIHTGSVTSCLVGKELPQFSLFGPNVIVASRLESTCPANAIHITESTLSQIDAHKYHLEKNGSPNLKGLGSIHQTYLIR